MLVNNGKLTVYNIQGILISEQILKQNITEIDLKSLDCGMYFIIISIDNKIITKKIVVK